jgi:hypothetical protein
MATSFESSSSKQSRHPPDVEIVAIGHPARRMRERGVSFEDIRSALTRAYSSWVTRDGSIQFEGPGVDGRTLKVWCLQPVSLDDDATVTVKSVAWKGEDDR